MTKKFLFLSFTACLVSLFAGAQNTPLSVDPVSKIVSNFYAKYQFNKVGAYDNDLQQWRTDHPPYQALTTVVFKIGDNGVGQIFLSQYGSQKLTYNISSSVNVGTSYVFTCITPLTVVIKITLFTKNNKAYQLHFQNDGPSNDNMSLVYF